MTTYVEEAKGTVLTLLDATQPYIQQNSGEGGAAYLKQSEDVVAVAQTGMATAGHGYRLLRFPTAAKVKSLEIYTDISLIDGGTSSTALVLEVGVVFSNDGEDGTPAGYQNLQPTTVGIGGGTTTAGTAVAIYGTSANFIFGTITANTTTGAMPGGVQVGLFGGEQVFGGVGATYGSAWTITNTPLCSIFNFWDGQGNVLSEMGYFDLLIGCHHAYNAQPATGYNIYARIEYAL